MVVIGQPDLSTRGSKIPIWWDPDRNYAVVFQLQQRILTLDVPPACDYYGDALGWEEALNKYASRWDRLWHFGAEPSADEVAKATEQRAPKKMRSHAPTSGSDGDAETTSKRPLRRLRKAFVIRLL